MTFSSFLLFSSQADLLVLKDWRGCITKERTQYGFEQLLKTPVDERTPITVIDGVTLFVYEVSQLFFCLTTVENPSPNFAFEVLHSFSVALNTVLAPLGEDRVRGNLQVCMEMISECFDHGIPQEMDAGCLRDRLQSRVLKSHGSYLKGRANGMMGRNRTGVYNRSIMETTTSGREEVFLDLLEQLYVTMNANGDISAAVVTGALQMKSFAERSINATIKMAPMQADVLAATHPALCSAATVHLEDVALHQAAQLLPTLDKRGFAQIVAPAEKGERVLLTYSTDLTKNRPELPFTCSITMGPDPEGYDKKAIITCKIQCNVNSKHGAQSIALQVFLPKFVRNATATATGMGKTAKPSTTWDADTATLTWSIPPADSKADFAMRGGSFVMLTVKAMLSKPYERDAFKRHTGPVNLSYTMHNVGVSGMKVAYLDFEGLVPTAKDSGPQKWLRTVSQTTSHTFRV